MRTVFSRLLLALALSATIVAPSVAVQESRRQDPTVYGTRTGTKYHADGCRYLRSSKIAMKLSEAKKRGLTACSKCRPGKE
jgi:hypothetical protein